MEMQLLFKVLAINYYWYLVILIGWFHSALTLVGAGSPGRFTKEITSHPEGNINGCTKFTHYQSKDQKNVHLLNVLEKQSMNNQSDKDEFPGSHEYLYQTTK